MATKFTDAEDAYLRAHHLTQAMQEMAAEMRRPRGSVASRCFKLGLSVPEEVRLRRLRESNERAREQKATGTSWDRFDARAASIWHLVDLKRAGFRAGHGELRIEREEGVYAPIRRETAYPCIGSPADLCADAG